MEQDFMSLGLDVSSFSDDKYATLSKFLLLFENLEKYAKLTINPILGPGLTEFNDAMKTTSTLLTEINTKLNQFNQSQNAGTNSTKNKAKATKELTQAEADLKVKIQEANRAMLEQAKANNASVQARNAQNKAIADQKKAEADLAAQQKKDAAEQKARDRQATADRKAQEAEMLAARRRWQAAQKEAQRASAEAETAQKRESAAVNKLSNDYELLKQVQRDQATAYANLYINKGGKAGGRSPEADQALADYKATSKTITDIETNLDRASGRAQLFGGALSTAFGHIRQLAYILPGLGIAGIFNLAFEAIGKALGELGLFSDATEKYLKYQLEVNKALAENVELHEDLYKIRLKLLEEENGRISRRDRDEINQAKGFDAVRLAEERRNLADQNVLSQSILMMGRGISPESLKSDLTKRLEVFDSYVKQIELLQKKIESANKPAKAAPLLPNGKRGDIVTTRGYSESQIEEFKQQKDILEQKLKNGQAQAKIDQEYLDKYLDSQKEYFIARAALQKLYDDEQRRLKVETHKSNLKLDEEFQEQILDKEISSEKDKLKALGKVRQDQLRENQINLYNVIGNKKLGIPEDPSATPTDIALAKKNKAAEDIRAEREYQISKFNLEEQYRQRRLTAQLAIDKNEVEERAIANERIYKDDNKSLDERLRAYIDYVKEKQLIQDKEYRREIDIQILKANDPTARKELERIKSDMIAQQTNIQADVQRQVYDIVYTSTQKQLKLIINTNKINDEVTTEQYTKELEKLNKSFADKEISYIKFRKRRKEIDYQFGKEALDEEIKQDEAALQRLIEHEDKMKSELLNAQKELQTAQDDLDFSKASGTENLSTQKTYDEAVGTVEGFAQAVTGAGVLTEAQRKKIAANKLKRAKLMPDDDEKERKQWLQAIKQMEEQIYRAVKEIGDREYQYRLDMLAKKKAIIDEQYGYEIAAVEKSSLYAKDKQALEIQLNEQKRQFDRNTVKEEKKIKHDQAVFDRDLAIAHIILSTAEAIAASLPIVPLAVAAGVAGAAQLAVATSVQIPSYAKGSQGLQEGQVARFGEEGPEWVKKPYQSKYLVTEETVGYLPKGTQITPVYDNPSLTQQKEQDNWEQTRWLAGQFKKAQQKANIVNHIHIDLGFETYKRDIIGN
jgi:hypothetical protein